MSFKREFADLDLLLKCKIKFFPIIAVCETKITKQTNFTTNIDFKSYFLKLAPTEPSAGVTLLYIGSLSYKPLNGINAYKAN